MTRNEVMLTIVCTTAADKLKKYLDDPDVYFSDDTFRSILFAYDSLRAVENHYSAEMKDPNGLFQKAFYMNKEKEVANVLTQSTLNKLYTKLKLATVEVVPGITQTDAEYLGLIMLMRDQIQESRKMMTKLPEEVKSSIDSFLVEIEKVFTKVREEAK